MAILCIVEKSIFKGIGKMKNPKLTIVILCNKGYDGRCFRKGYNLKMCQENMYYACEYTGYTNDYCKNPC